jgi:hypothetical protein
MPESRLNIATAGNVVVPAFLALIKKGYTVTFKKDGDVELWTAEGPLGRFIGEDPPLVLGLVALGETRNGDWKATDEEIDYFFSKFPVE